MTSLPERIIPPGTKTARYGVVSSVLWPEYRVFESPIGRLVGSCTTEIAAWAVWRLMHVDWLVEAITTGATFNAGKVGDPMKASQS
jgi:hypothetical protein